MCIRLWIRSACMRTACVSFMRSFRVRFWVEPDRKIPQQRGLRHIFTDVCNLRKYIFDKCSQLFKNSYKEKPYKYYYRRISCLIKRHIKNIYRRPVVRKWKQYEKKTEAGDIGNPEYAQGIA